MKVETFADLIDWTRAMHHRLAECLAHCSTHSERALAKLLLTYLADHEATLEKIVDGFEQRADPKALNTWVYDYLGHEPIDPHRACDAPFAQMTFDEICTAVFDLHNQVITLYRYLLGRAEIPEARELLEALLDMEEHETMRIAQQSNRIRDM
ncbi:MAG: ATPase [Pseudomonadales bacterium]